MTATSLPLPGGAADQHPLLRTLFRQTTTGVALLSYDGRYVAVNDALCELLGRSESELVGLSWRDVTHPDDIEASERVVAAIKRGDELELKAEKRYLRPDGDVRWAMLGTSLVQDDAGQPIGFLSQVLDVTGRKHAEETLRTEGGLLELLTAVTVGMNESVGAERAFRVAVNAVCAYTGWRIGHAVRVDGGRLVTAGVWVASEPATAGALRDALSDRPPGDLGAAGEAVRSRRPVWVHDLAVHPTADAWRAAGVEAVGAWPVIAAGEVVAVLEFGSAQPDEPAEPLANVLGSVCSQLAQADQRMQTLERLRSSQRQLSEAHAVAGLGSWRWNIDTGAVVWSDQFFRLLGREPQSVAPSLEWLIAHVHEDDRERVCAHIEHTLVSGEQLDVEFRLVCADGQVRTVLGGGQVASSDGTPTRHFVGYLQDITARAQVQAALGRSEERVRLVLQTSSDAFVEFDRDWMVAEWNRAAETLFGWSRAEAVGRRIDELLAPPGEAGERLLATLTRLDSPALEAPVEATARHRDGRLLPIEVTIPRTPDSVLRSTFIRDISERKSAERALQESNASLRSSLSALERRSQEVAVLNEMIDLLQSAGEAAEGYRVIAQHAATLFPEASGTVYVAENADRPLVAVADWGGYEPLERTLDGDDCWALRRGRLHRAEPGASALYCPHARNEDGHTICVPMVVQGETVALVHLRAEQAVDATGARDLLATDFAERTALALANMRLRERLRAQSIRDPLTGLFNRRYLEETFERELRRARRNAYSLGVAMVDLDHFKQFNDRFGHQVGDVALQEFARYLEGRVRADDVVCRYGGEEFVLLFPNATLAQVRERCEALRSGAAAVVLPSATSPWQTTVSVGVASFPGNGDDTASILQAADAALYAAKRTGRDRVIVAQPVL